MLQTRGFIPLRLITEDIYDVSERYFAESKGFSIGRWIDLDNAAGLDWAIDEVGASTISDLIGSRTAHPVGFSYPEMVLLFYKVKTFTLTSDFPGTSGDSTDIYYASSSDLLSAVVGSAREKLLHNPMEHKAVNAATTDVSFSLMPKGYFSSDLFYPQLIYQANWDDGTDTGTASSSDPGAPAPSAGTLTILGQSVPLYQTSGPAITGAPTVTIGTTW